jgi:RNA-binding protein YhbY
LTLDFGIHSCCAKGLTGEVVAEIDRALKVHELIKVRAAALEKNDE